MSGYLQRLLDRAAPAPPPSGLLPAGPTRSPVGLADQRLNDSGFSERPAPPEPGESVETVTNATAPARPVFRSGPRIYTREIASQEESASLPEPTARTAPGAAPNTTPGAAHTSVPVTTPSPVDAPRHPSPVGFVGDSDLVLPEPDPAPQAEIAKVAASVPRPQRPTSNAPLAPVEPPQPAPHANEGPENPRTDTRPPEASPALARPGTRPTLVPQAPDPSAVGMPAEVVAPPQPSPLVELVSPPMAMPLPLPADPPEPATRQPETPPKAPKAPKADKAPTPTETRRAHPMTASTASVIGQLTPRRRALTLFGLRRR